MDKKKEIRRFFLLQVNDALFPIGGYSHSQGLETYIQQGRVHDEKTAAEYISKKLKLNLACTDLLGVRLAYEYALKEDVDALDTLEEILGASRIPMEQREASRKMGSRFTKTVCKLPQEKIPMEKREVFEKYLETRKGKPVSHCCAYGVFCAALGIEEEETLYHYLYAQTSAMVTNCVKTIPLSQSAGQTLLCGCYEEFEEILSYIMDCTEDDLCLSAPGFDIRGIQHEKLYSRLYMSYVKIGVAGPVGSGKTALIEALSRKMAKDYSIGVITNDIYTKEDAQFLAKNSVLPVERIIGVETGGCPHTAIREDASMNLEAVDEMMERFPDIQLLFIESGGDNLSATFSPELVDATIFVIDVAEGDKIPRKGGPGITRSDLLVINKIDLAPYVGASLEVMERDSRKMRGERPFVFTNIRGDENVDTVVEWIKKNVLLEGL